jgi:hypothetical protein
VALQGRTLRRRPKCYDGKVNFDDLNRFELVDEIDAVKLYTAIVNSAHFKRDLRIVYLVKTVGKKLQTALLFSTDLKLAAKDIYRFYKALHFHFNAAMTALNLLKLEDRQQTSDTELGVISIASWKIRKANAHLLKRFSSILGLDFSFIKSQPEFKTLCNYGAILP